MPKIKLTDLIRKRFGIKTGLRINPLVSSVGTSVTKILDDNPNRVAWRVVNLSSNILYVLHDEEVSSSRGIRLVANGGTAGEVFDEDFNVTGFALYAVASGASSAIMVYEIVISSSEEV